jgi:hypothetical protein
MFTEEYETNKLCFKSSVKKSHKNKSIKLRNRIGQLLKKCYIGYFILVAASAERSQKYNLFASF